jgi:hypothetical protein
VVGGGARFFDERKRDRGCAREVVRRVGLLGRLVVLDILSTDQPLLAFLRALDKSPLQVQALEAEGASYRFLWASGYENGVGAIRLQGILQDA